MKKKTLICNFQGFCLLRSIRQEVLCKKDVLRNFARFTIHRKLTEPESFLIKLQTSSLQLHLKRHSGTGVFL